MRTSSRFSVEASANCFSIFVGSHSSSSSSIAIHSPRAARMPMFLALEMPTLVGFSTTRKRGSSTVARDSRVAASGPSITTTISISLYVCAQILATARRTRMGLFKVQITAETVGIFSIIFRGRSKLGSAIPTPGMTGKCSGSRPRCERPPTYVNGPVRDGPSAHNPLAGEYRKRKSSLVSSLSQT